MEPGGIVGALGGARSYRMGSCVLTTPGWHRILHRLSFGQHSSSSSVWGWFIGIWSVALVSLCSYRAQW